ncbi:hypothetical protein TraAM80_05461, partial [Trypanosoma rangeli]
DVVRSEVAAREMRLAELDARIGDASAREEMLAQRLESLEVELEDVCEAKRIVESLMEGLTKEFETAVVNAEDAEDAMLRHVDRAEELLRLSEADAVSREAATIERIHRMTTSCVGVGCDDGLLQSYEGRIAAVVDLFTQLIGRKLELLLGSLAQCLWSVTSKPSGNVLQWSDVL